VTGIVQKRLYRFDEVGNLLSLSVASIRRLVSKGELQGVRATVGRGLRITADSLVRYVARRRALTSNHPLSKCIIPERALPQRKQAGRGQ